MNAPSFSELMLDVESEFPSVFSDGAELTEDQVVRLERISQAAADSASLITVGIAGIGELIAWTCDSGNADMGTISSVGWLIQELATTVDQLQGQRNSAEYKLQNLPRSAPHKPMPTNRGADSGVQP